MNFGGNQLFSICIFSQRGKRIVYIVHLKQQVVFIYLLAQMFIYKQRKLPLVGIWSGIESLAFVHAGLRFHLLVFVMHPLSL